jgi:hypothetical protein
MNLECNIFNGIYDKDCSNVVQIKSVLSAIKNGRWKEQILELQNETNVIRKKTLKEKLPAVTFCGVFEERLDNAYVVYNQLMIVDIDKINEKRLQSLKLQMRDNTYVLAYFESPNGGLKVLIPIDSSAEKHSADAFYYVEGMFKNLYNIQIDKSGKNISRLCFISYDENAFYNPNCYVLHIPEVVREIGFEEIKNNTANYIPSHDADYIFKTCIKMVKKSKVGNYRKGNRNNYIFVLSCLLCEFGVYDNQALTLVFQKYNSLQFQEVKATVNSAYRKNKHKFATKSINQRINVNQTNFDI